MSESMLPAPHSGAPIAASTPSPHDTRSLTTTYSNVFRASGSAEEVILDFGLDAHQHTAHGAEPVVMTQRLVLTWNNAQRLALLLHDLLHFHDSHHSPFHPDAGNHPPSQPATPSSPRG